MCHSVCRVKDSLLGPVLSYHMDPRVGDQTLIIRLDSEHFGPLSHLSCLSAEYQGTVVATAKAVLRVGIDSH